MKKITLRQQCQLVLLMALLWGTMNVVAQNYVRTFNFDFLPENVTVFQLGEGDCEISSGVYEWQYSGYDIGKPALPYVQCRVLLPDNYEISGFTYSVDAAKQQIKHIVRYTTSEDFFSGKGDTLAVDNIVLSPSPELVPESSVTTKSQPYPLVIYSAEVKDHDSPSWIDGYKIEEFGIYPFSYDAANGKLELSTQVGLTLTISHISEESPTHRGNRDDLIKNMVCNPEDLGKGTANWTRVNDKAISVQGKEWNLSRIMPHIVSYVYDVKQWIDGDTLVDGKLCKKLYTLTTTEDERISQKEKLEVGYCWQDGDKFYKNGVLMFDFGLKEGEIFSFWEEEETYAIVTHVGDTILTDGVSRKYLTLRHYHPEWDIIAQASDKWIEGIGSLNTGVYDNLFMGVGGFNTTLLSCTLNENVLYEKEGSNQVKVAEKSNGRCHFHLTNSSITCTSPSAIQLEIYTPDAVKVGQSSFRNGEAVVKVDRVPATYLYIVTYPDGRRESGKVMVK